MFTILHLFLIWRILSVLVTCYSYRGNIVYNTHIREDSWKTACTFENLNQYIAVAEYGRPFVWKLWLDIRTVFFPRILAIIPATRYMCVFCHVYLRSFLLCGVFIPKYMTIFLQTRIYMRTKKPIYMRYKQACVYGVTESRHIRDIELYRQQKTPSCTMELKSNFS